MAPEILSRRDLHVGPLHVIKHPYRDPAQYGSLPWGRHHLSAAPLTCGCELHYRQSRVGRQLP